MTTFLVLHKPEYLFNLTIYLFLSKKLPKSSEFTIYILFEYHCSILAQRHAVCFSEILEKDFKQTENVLRLLYLKGIPH